MGYYPLNLPSHTPAMASIILVDDDDLFRSTLREALIDAGHEVRDAAGGIDALRMFEERRADIVITDVIMPEMDGTALAGALHRIDPEVRMITVSGHSATAEFLNNTPPLRCHRVLQKPFALAALLDTITEIADPDGP